MLKTVRNYIFALYERPLLRNWFYTLAFAIFVPVGCRFALLAWDFGSKFDRGMTVVAGLAVGITTIVTLVRIWSVPPSKTIVHIDHSERHHVEDLRPLASEMVAVAKAYSARNRQIAQGARALGSPRALRR
jgi:hypothetical protein